VTHCYTYFSS